MKAAVFKQAGAPLVIEEVVEPEPGPDDLILKVKRVESVAPICIGLKVSMPPRVGAIW